ncbi:MAG: ABC transporter ATP-binding protein, partial [Chloroflexota bacterium]
DRVVGIRDGRTSTEIRRERNVQDGTVDEEEWVILDRAGRLQLPQVYVDTLAMQGRVRARLESNHVSIWPSTAVSTPEEPQEEVKIWRPSKEFAFEDDPAPMVSETAVQINQLWRTFQTDVEEIHAVQNVTLNIPSGQMVVIKGRSGSGKTTLLNLIGTLDEPSQGDIFVEGQSISGLTQDEKINLRRHKIGFVFQTFGLLPFLSARENIEAPLRLLRTDRHNRHRQTDEALALVGLTNRSNHRTHELSGGEQQRVALARALVTRPTLILADEPTGQLDTVTGSNIVMLLREIAHQTGITVIMASHDPKVEEAADHIFELHDGQLMTIGEQDENR